MEKINLGYNSTYISSNLIDELDYVIGGYGQPNTTFIYSLNCFLEAFILNSNFFLSEQEIKHIQILSKSLFPNGRPVLEMLSKTKSLNVIGGIGNNIGRVVSIINFNSNNPTTYQERIQQFIDEGIDTTHARKEYLVIPNIDTEVSKLLYLSVGKVGGGFVATAHENSPQEFYKQFCNITCETNIQATLPFYSYQYQISEIKQRGIAKDVIVNLSKTFEEKRKPLEQYFGSTHQSLPPLVTILLTQCHDISDIPSKMLQLRNDFTKLRECISTYEKRIAEANNIKDQIDAIDELNQFWSTFHKKYSENKRLLYQFWEIANESDYEKSLDNSIDSTDTSKMLEDLNTGKVIGKGASKLYSWYKDKKIINRFRGVTDIWSLFENAPNLRKQITEYERLFKVSLDRTELDRLQNKIKVNDFRKK